MSKVYVYKHTDVVSRKKNDYYPTPMGAVKKAFEHLPELLEGQTYLDFGCGNGVWSDYLYNLDATKTIFGVDIDDSFPYNHHFVHGDVGDVETFSGFEKFDWVFGNPPYFNNKKWYKVLPQIAKKAYLLLPINYVESHQRQLVNTNHLVSYMPYVGRIDFIPEEHSSGPVNATGMYYYDFERVVTDKSIVFIDYNRKRDEA